MEAIVTINRYFKPLKPLEPSAHKGNKNLSGETPDLLLKRRRR